jgi:hypothetical protein
MMTFTVGSPAAAARQSFRGRRARRVPCNDRLDRQNATRSGRLPSTVRGRHQLAAGAPSVPGCQQTWRSEQSTRSRPGGSTPAQRTLTDVALANHLSAVLVRPNVVPSYCVYPVLWVPLSCLQEAV